ncbi:MAG: hypothetical protein IJW77_11930 [Clostridia bacterium]|nr:hypothetical protein [Clostridia bacterium]
MSVTKGFLTIATGDEHYYRIAANLVRSYKQQSNPSVPFTLLADRDNEYTKEFDQVIILPHPKNNYLDKLEVFKYLPYDTNIFIDADCLVYGNIARLFDIFEEYDDFCCFGRVLPLEDTTGWFEFKDIGELQKKVDYVVGLHGGIYYMRKTDLCRKVLADAKEFSLHYEKYHFKGKFQNPGDEPVVALSMAVNHCHPIQHDNSVLLCYWEHENQFDLDISSGIAFCKMLSQKTDIVHWGTRFTHQLLYQKEEAALNLLVQGASKCRIAQSNRSYDQRIWCSKVKNYVIRVKNKLSRILHTL